MINPSSEKNVCIFFEKNSFIFTWRIPSCLFLHNYPVHLQVFVKHVGSSFDELPCDIFKMARSSPHCVRRCSSL
jgi:hypothetical protein